MALECGWRDRPLTLSPPRGRGNMRSVLHQEALDAFPGVDFARVDISTAVGCHHVNPMEAAAGMAEETEMAERLAARAIHDPHHIVHDVGDVEIFLVR